MADEIHVVDVAPVFTAVIRERVARAELSRFVPAACGEVWSFLRDAGLPKPGRHLALYGADGMVEAGVEVGSPLINSGRVLGSQLPSGRAITMVHHGPYDRLGETHARIREWCAVQALRSAGICWELYGHWEEGWNEDASLIRTDVFHLLKPEDIQPADPP
jgi:effector-binding domain-containing protein